MSDLDKWLGRGDNPPTVPIDPKDICKIIKEANANGVSHLEYLDLKITFHNKPTLEASFAQQRPLELSALSPQSLEKLESLQSKEQEKSLLEETIETKQRLVDDMHVLDPLEYERLTVSGELEDLGKEDLEDNSGS